MEGAWPARPDYYHGPYYDKDVNISKTLTKEESFGFGGRIHDPGGRGLPDSNPSGREGLQGIDGTWVWTMGGVDAKGRDACNELTIAFMQAARLVRVANPTFAFRWHPKVSDEVMREIFECIRQGHRLSGDSP
ncbi:MAG: pyruvate formate lyase family protein [Desulfobacterales bacterium]